MEAHLERCARCRQALGTAALSGADVRLRVLPGAPAASGCPSDEDLVRQAVSTAHDASLEEHLVACPACAEAMRGLQAFRMELDATDWEEARRLARPLPWWRRAATLPWPRLALAGAAGAALMACILLPSLVGTRRQVAELRSERDRWRTAMSTLGERVAELTHEQNRLREQQASAARAVEETRRELRAARGALQAARRMAALAPSGGPRPLVNPPARQEAVDPVLRRLRAMTAQALESGRLPIPRATLRLADRPRTLLGPPHEQPHHVALAPRAEMVRSVRPVFRWTTRPDAESYTVTVVDDAAQREVWRSAVVRPAPNAAEATAAPPNEAPPLAPGRVYRWYVTATLPGGQQADSPGPSDPVARFRVLSPQEAADLARWQEAASGDPLALAVAESRLGLLGEAEEALRRALAGGAPPRKVRPLLDQIAALRGFRRK